MPGFDRPAPLPRNLVEAVEMEGRTAWLAALPTPVAKLAGW
jgi:hypothetical protein